MDRMIVFVQVLFFLTYAFQEGRLFGLWLCWECVLVLLVANAASFLNR